MADEKRTFLPKARLEAMLDAARSFPHMTDDWKPVTESKITKIVYSDRKNFDLKFNLKMAKDTLLAKKDHWLGGPLAHRLKMSLYMLTHVETNAPDAELFNGSIICYWQEHADYLEEMEPEAVTEALRELLLLRAFREEMGYLALALDPEDGKSTAVDAHGAILQAMKRVDEHNDWIADESLTRAEKLERFQALSPEPTRGPASYEELANLAEAKERLGQVSILAHAWRIAAEQGLITSETREEFATTAADALDAALRGETTYGKPQG